MRLFWSLAPLLAAAKPQDIGTGGVFDSPSAEAYYIKRFVGGSLLVCCLLKQLTFKKRFGEGFFEKLRETQKNAGKGGNREAARAREVSNKEGRANGEALARGGTAANYPEGETNSKAASNAKGGAIVKAAAANREGKANGEAAPNGEGEASSKALVDADARRDGEAPAAKGTGAPNTEANKEADGGGKINLRDSNDGGSKELVFANADKKQLHFRLRGSTISGL